MSPVVRSASVPVRRPNEEGAELPPDAPPPAHAGTLPNDQNCEASVECSSAFVSESPLVMMSFTRSK